MTVRFILSDIGGVLVRLSEFHREEAVARRYGLDPAEVRDVIYFEDDRFRALERGNLPWRDYRIMTLHRLQQLGAVLEEDAVAHFTRVWGELLQEPILPVARLWMALRRHMNIASASNIDSQSFDAGVAPHPIVANLFHHRTHSFQLGRRKGDENYFSALRGQLGAHPEQCFFVDDKEEHVEAARHHGIHAFHMDRVDTATMCELKARLVEAGVRGEWVSGESESVLRC